MPVTPAPASPAHAAIGAPSAWVQRFADLLPPGARALDLACGSGRHVHWLAAQGHRVTGVDRDGAALAALAAALPAAARAHTELLHADLEGAPWPLPGRLFDAVIVTNYLHRPLFQALRDALAPGGVLLVETFAHGQQSIGRPARADFLLQPGELLAHCAGLRVVAFEDGFEPAGEATGARFVQRIAAVREVAADALADATADATPDASAASAPPRYALRPQPQAPAR